jgi:hypothetical protein
LASPPPHRLEAGSLLSCPSSIPFSLFTELFYDLKKFLEESKAAVPSGLAQHEASRQKPGTIGGGRPSVQFAKK